MINSRGSALEPADGRIYPERAGLPAPVTIRALLWWRLPDTTGRQCR